MKTVAMIFLIAAAFCAGPAYAVQEGQSLSVARAELLRDGWRPVETTLKDEDGELLRLFGDGQIVARISAQRLGRYHFMV
jgi:hypothetical protein